VTLLLRYILGLMGIGFGGKPGTGGGGGGGDGGLTLNKPYLVLRTGMKDGKQVALVMDGDCADGITQDKPRTSLRTGTKDGKQVQLVADQKLDPDGKLIIGKPYLALRTGIKDGKQVVLVAGKQCDDEPPDECGDCLTCPVATVYPGTLNITVNISSFLAPFVFTATSAGGDETLGGCGLASELMVPGLVNPGDVINDKTWTGSYALGGSAGTFLFDDCVGFGGSFSSSESVTCSVIISRRRFVDVDGCIKSYFIASVPNAIERLNSTGRQKQATLSGTTFTAISCAPLDLSVNGGALPCIGGGGNSYAQTNETVGAFWTIDATE
jgi:hypothetical protein